MIYPALAAACLFSALGQRVVACPFCNAVQPTLVQRREAATVVAIGELLSSHKKQQRFRVHAVLKGQPAEPKVRGEIELDAEVPRTTGQLVVLFANGAEGQYTWQAVDADETLLSYFHRAPSLREPAPERLRYFAKYLEDRSAAIAEDAYLEFGHAPYDEVAQVADAFPSERLRAWLLDDQVPQHRKGFYGLALGLKRAAAEQQANLDFLRQRVLEPSEDFRAGFDGILGGYLLAGGSAALQTIDERLLSVPEAPEGDLRHAVKALRFLYEFGREIPPAEIATAMRHFLDRPGFAAAAIVDLARWQDWDCLDRVVALYEVPGTFQNVTRRAVVGYLAHCPRAEAGTALEQLKQRDPQGVAAALEDLDRLGGTN